MNNEPIIKALKTSCAFILEVSPPLKTLSRVIDVLTSRDISIDTLQLHQLQNDHALIIFHCHLEKDRIKAVAILLEKMTSVKSLECLDAKTRDKFYS